MDLRSDENRTGGKTTGGCNPNPKYWQLFTRTCLLVFINKLPQELLALRELLVYLLCSNSQLMYCVVAKTGNHAPWPPSGNSVYFNRLGVIA